MEQSKNDNHISDLLYKHVVGTLSEGERVELDAWVAARPARKKYLQMLSSPAQLEEGYRKMKAANVNKAIAEMEERINNVNVNDNDNRPAGDNVPVTTVSHQWSISNWMKVAAVLLLIVGGAFWYREHTRITPPEISEEVQTAMQLSRESGHVAAKVEDINPQPTSSITQEVRQLYHVDEQFVEQLAEAKRITTYQDKEYWVVLDDGTLVHLNYNSRLIYPERFGDRRDVILDGEAYFMVAKDKSRQFVVHTPQGDIRVYGTEFMVNTAESMESRLETVADESAYHQATSVVLVKGSISFTPENGNELMLSPGQKLLADKDQMLVTTTDTVPYVAWNTGMFVFKKSTLENLMNVISRWYGVKHVAYSNEKLRKIHFTGNFKRYGSIERILDAIMMTCDISIDFHNNRITVEEKVIEY
ncbi:MAG: DUF4974 domain-containing protein [Prevotella sp.]|nr:DUF4974 domain-containing protein [Prevotella sp.]